MTRAVSETKFQSQKQEEKEIITKQTTKGKVNLKPIETGTGACAFSTFASVFFLAAVSVSDACLTMLCCGMCLTKIR
jgi:hypothetical protein